jgi:hypothetical protein
MGLSSERPAYRGKHGEFPREDLLYGFDNC